VLAIVLRAHPARVPSPASSAFRCCLCSFYLPLYLSRLLAIRRWASYTCKNRCNYAKALPPEPAPYRACASGCEKGGNFALEVGCGAVLEQGTCEEKAKKDCEAKHCADLKDEVRIGLLVERLVVDIGRATASSFAC